MPPTTVQPPSTTTGISSLPTHILESHILTHLDAQSLASATCASTTLSAGHHHLWSTICHSTWPSTTDDLITKIISNFSGDSNGYRSFFSHSFPLLSPDPTAVPPPPQTPPPSSPANELISAVDIHHRKKPIFTKTEVTETTSNWFRCSPFRIDLLDPKNAVGTQVPYPGDEAACMALIEDMTLSWILIDPINKRSVNLSSNKPVSVHRHWLSGEVQLRFVSILADGNGSAVQCRIVVNSGESEEGKMQLREVTLEMEDIDEKRLDGRGSSAILHMVMEGKRGTGVNRDDEGRRRCRKFERMKRQRRERRSRVEGTLDILFLIFGFSIFVVLFFTLFS